MKQTIYVLIFLLNSSFYKADSPLTSITFWKVYKNERIVNKAFLAKQKMTNELANYLILDNPVDVKFAVINALGWNANGQNNSKMFLNFIKKKLKIKNIKDLGNRNNILICYAYLQAMDNYFDVGESLKLVESIKKYNKDNIEYDFVYSLLSSQHILNNFGSFCSIYKESEILINNKNKNKIKQEAWKMYFDYFNLYKDDCN